VELSITEDAANEFNKSVEGIEPKPFLRVGARPGGCSGWIFTLSTEDEADPTDSLFDGHGVDMLIDTEQHEKLIGDLRIEYNRTNLVEQGFVFRRTTKGTVCGCGESFTPLNSNKPLGWEETT
jgi:iron-sulfur cluster assembly protein